MPRLAILLLLVLVPNVYSFAQEPAATGPKQVAIAMANATQQGDYVTVINHTFMPLVEYLGGREKAVATTKATIAQLGKQGIKIEKMQIRDPSAVVAEGNFSFVVVPTTVTMSSPKGKIAADSYLLGISADGAKSWKFLDGAGMQNKTLRDKILPKLPDALKIPSPSKPRLVDSSGKTASKSPAK